MKKRETLEYAWLRHSLQVLTDLGSDDKRIELAWRAKLLRQRMAAR